MQIKKLLKVLNPIIWCWNFFKYTSHLDIWCEMQNASDEIGDGHKVEYIPYDFSKKTKYF